MLYYFCMAETLFCPIYSNWRKKAPKKILFIFYIFYFMDAPSLDVLKAILDQALSKLV